jgi:outer membrane protein TolC
MVKRLYFLPVIAIIILVNPLCAEQNTVSLKFSDIRSWAETKSPEVRLIRRQGELELADARIELQVSNPEFSFTREHVKNGGFLEVEQVLELSKSVEMPWIYNLRRKSWQARKQTMQLSEEDSIREIVGRMKTGYVELAAMRAQMEEFRGIRKVLDQVSAIAASRKREGFLAGYEERLIDTARRSLEIRILRFSLEQMDAENRWKQAMGIGEEQKLNLETPAMFKPVNLDSPGDYDRLSRESPGYRMHLSLQEVLEKSVAVEKLSAWPGVTLSGGYKTVSEGFKGYTVGLSFALPLFNRNKAAVRTRQLSLDIHREQFDLYKKEKTRTIRQAVTAVTRFQQLLKGMAEQQVSPAREMRPVVSAFREGTVSLNDLLSALQVHIEGMEQYYSLLTGYYAHIFHLEAVTGRNLILFN